MQVNAHMTVRNVERHLPKNIISPDIHIDIVKIVSKINSGRCFGDLMVVSLVIFAERNTK
jgi:hypothetical protein